MTDNKNSEYKSCNQSLLSQDPCQTRTCDTSLTTVVRPKMSDIEMMVGIHHTPDRPKRHTMVDSEGFSISEGRATQS